MKKLLSAILVLTLLFCLSACGNGGEGGSNDAAGSGEANTSGKTKILSELKSDDGKLSFTYKWIGNTLTMEQKAVEKKTVNSTTTYEYNENGNLMKVLTESEMNGETSQSSATYKYDDKGRKIYYSHVMSRSPNMNTECTYTYSDDGKTCTASSANNSEIWTYNDKGLLTEVRMPSTSDGSDVVGKYEYDESGHCTSYIVESYGDISLRVIMTYTADGKLATMTFDEKLYTCAYDDEGYLKTVSVDDTILKAVWVDGTEFERNHTPAFPISTLAGVEINYYH